MDGELAVILHSPLPLTMDSVFLLAPDARARFLHSAGRALGCSFASLWSYFPHPSNCLISTDGWFHEDDESSPSRRLFDAYRASFCSVESGCVPGLVYKEGLPYVELVGMDLMNMAATQVQRQFYQEAGIKRAVFVGCKSGEIEFGSMSSALSNITIDMIHQLFSDDFIQQCQLPDQSRPSSSSSSLRSLSVGSPEYSSLFLNKASSSFLPADAGDSMQLQNPLILPHQVAMQAYNSRHQNVRFATPASDEAAITQAIYSVIASSAPSSTDQVQTSRTTHPLRAFKPYNLALGTNSEFRPRLGGQRMIKMGLSILRRINMLRVEEARAQESRPPTSNQLHHMISERKRREKINESFHALKMLLPPGTKKDKASVLSTTKAFVSTLKAQISELEEKNRMLELQLVPPELEAQEAGESSERVHVEITRAAESTSEMQQISLRITVRVQCDMVDLLLPVLECLKEMGVVSLVSVDASMQSPQTNMFARVVLVLQVKTSDWDEESFKEAVTRAIDGVVAARPATETTSI